MQLKKQLLEKCASLVHQEELNIKVRETARNPSGFHSFIS